MHVICHLNVGVSVSFLGLLQLPAKQSLARSFAMTSNEFFSKGGANARFLIWPDFEKNV